MLQLSAGKVFVPETSVREDATRRAPVYVRGSKGKALFENKQLRTQDSDFMEQFLNESLIRKSNFI